MGKLTGKAKEDFLKKMAAARKKAAKSGKKTKKTKVKELIGKAVSKVTKVYEKRFARLEKQLGKKKK